MVTVAVGDEVAVVVGGGGGAVGVPVTVAGGPAPTSVHVAPPLRFTVCSAAELTARTWTAYVVSFARSLMV